MCLGDIHLRIAGAFLEYRNSFSKHPVTDGASHLDYIKANFYVNAYSFHPGFQFQKRYNDQWVSQASYA